MSSSRMSTSPPFPAAWATLSDLRDRDLAAARIGRSVPIRVTESGWPTGTNPLTGSIRSDERQAHVIDAIVRAVHENAAKSNVSHYMLFGLRDADSNQADLFHQFGITRDDYSPKAAYETFRSLVHQFRR